MRDGFADGADETDRANSILVLIRSIRSISESFYIACRLKERHFHKTRIAPTPSGYLHLGNAYSFLLTQALAQRTNAKILLRIDDLDAQRVRKEYLDDIFDTLNFLEIAYDEGPRDFGEYETGYAQRHRMHLYEDALQKLMNKGLVYACRCSRTSLEGHPCACDLENIPFNTPQTALRLRTGDEELAVRTPDRGVVTASLPLEMKDFIVRKKDGMPAYQLASMLDDVHFGIDLIVRGEDLWASTLAQLYLAEKLNAAAFLNTTFYHHALIGDKENGKLSKSAGALSVQALRREGKSLTDILSLPQMRALREFQ